jgi:hypothetical protein
MDFRFALGLTVFLQSHNWVGPGTEPWPRLGDLSSVQSPTVVPSNVVSPGAVDSGVEVCEIIPVRGYALRACWQRHRWLVRPSRAAESKGRQNNENFKQKKIFCAQQILNDLER